MASNLLTLTELMVNEPTKSTSQKNLPIFSFLFDLSLPKGGLSGRMTWQFLNTLELFSP